MALDEKKKLNRIAACRKQFEQVFGGPVTAGRISQAPAAHERTIVSCDTPPGRYNFGGVTDAA